MFNVVAAKFDALLSPFSVVLTCFSDSFFTLSCCHLFNNLLDFGNGRGFATKHLCLGHAPKPVIQGVEIWQATGPWNFGKSENPKCSRRKFITILCDWSLRPGYNQNPFSVADSRTPSQIFHVIHVHQLPPFKCCNKRHYADLNVKDGPN